MSANKTASHLLKILQVLGFAAFVVLAASCSSGPHPGTIAFEREEGGQGDIYAIQTDGTALARLVDGPCTWMEHPAWSPDGNRIAYHCGFGEVPTYSVWTMSSDGSDPVRITQPPLAALWPSWSPDGAHIVFSVYASDKGTFDIHAVDPDGKSIRPLTSGDRYDLFPTWSSNGTILFLRTKSEQGSGDLFAVNPDGSGLVQLTNTGHVNGFAPSPDGTTIAFSDNEYPPSIMLLAAGDGGSPVALIDTDLACVYVALAWAPDGQAVTMGCSDYQMTNGSEIHIFNAEGSGLTIVPNTGSAFDPAWRPK